MAAPARRGTAQVSSSSTVQTGISNFAAPAALTNNDVWVVTISHQATGVTTATPSGWTQLVDSTEDAQGHRMYVFWKFWHTADPTTQTFTFSGAGSAYGAISHAYSGTDQTTPFGTPVLASDQTLDLALDVAALTTTGTDSLSVVYTGHQSNATTTTPTNGYSEVATAGGKRSEVADQTRATPTSIGAITFTLSGNTRGHSAHVELFSPVTAGGVVRPSIYVSREAQRRASRW